MSVMITRIIYLRISSVMITDRETNFTDLQANDFGNLGKNNPGNILLGNHAVIFTEINCPRYFFRSLIFVWTMVLLYCGQPEFLGNFLLSAGRTNWEKIT